jgi:hypothetical protein
MRIADINIGDRLAVGAFAPCLIEAKPEAQRTVFDGDTAQYSTVEGKLRSSLNDPRPFHYTGPRHSPVTVMNVGVPYRKRRSGVTVIGIRYDRPRCTCASCGLVHIPPGALEPDTDLWEREVTVTVHCSSLRTAEDAEVTEGYLNSCATRTIGGSNRS